MRYKGFKINWKMILSCICVIGAILLACLKVEVWFWFLFGAILFLD